MSPSLKTVLLNFFLGSLALLHIIHASKLPGQSFFLSKTNLDKQVQPQENYLVGVHVENHGSSLASLKAKPQNTVAEEVKQDEIVPNELKDHVYSIGVDKEYSESVKDARKGITEMDVAVEETTPTFQPTQEPDDSSFAPTHETDEDKSFQPTSSFTDFSSVAPTTDKPSRMPTVMPSDEPTKEPSLVPSCSPTIAPTRSPTATPTLTLPPSVRPTLAPTVLPTRVPTLAPTVTPSRIPTGAPSRRPTVSPTPAPTFQTEPVMSFDSTIKMNGLESLDVSDGMRDSIISAQATSMNLPRSSISFLGLRESDERNSNRKTKHQVKAINAEALTRAIINMVDYPPDTDPTALFNSLSAALVAAVSSGDFLTALQEAAAENGITLPPLTLDVEVGTLALVQPPTFKPTVAPEAATLSDGEIAGIVIAVVVGLPLLIFVIVHLVRSNVGDHKIAPQATAPSAAPAFESGPHGAGVSVVPTSPVATPV
eukprot:gene28081-33910_t